MHYRSRNAGTENKSKRPMLIVLGIASVILALIIILILTVGTGRRREATVTQLPCYANQDVTPFGVYVLFYDGASLHCLTNTGATRWSQTFGEGARYSVSDRSIVVWVNTKVYIIDYNGRITYNDTLGETVQFARIGDRYCAAVIGPETSPTLVVRDLEGVQVDQEAAAFQGMLLLDVGFYGDKGQYMWTTTLDVFGVAPNVMLNTFEVGNKNTGESALGEHIAYHLLYENSKLRVVTTQFMRTFNYQGIESTNDLKLVYGWHIVDSFVPQHGDALMIFAKSSNQTAPLDNSIAQIRLLTGSVDRRFTLPTTCVGAVIYNRSFYAFSKEFIYQASANSQRFTTYQFPIPGVAPTAVLGLLEGGHAVVACGNSVYVVTLPNA